MIIFIFENFFACKGPFIKSRDVNSGNLFRPETPPLS
eukprot:UN05239